jgi:hypothetical protein
LFTSPSPCTLYTLLRGPTYSCESPRPFSSYATLGRVLGRPSWLRWHAGKLRARPRPKRTPTAAAKAVGKQTKHHQVVFLNRVINRTCIHKSLQFIRSLYILGAITTHESILTPIGGKDKLLNNSPKNKNDTYDTGALINSSLGHRRPRLFICI